VSELPFDPSYPKALAFYCSDGRFTRAIEELLSDDERRSPIVLLARAGSEALAADNSDGT